MVVCVGSMLRMLKNKYYHKQVKHNENVLWDDQRWYRIQLLLGSAAAVLLCKYLLLC